jgi:hypothetical protein
MLSENVDRGIPEPPTCVLDYLPSPQRPGPSSPTLAGSNPGRTAESGISPPRSPGSRRWVPEKPWQSNLGEPGLEDAENVAQVRSPRSPSPRKDFIERNKQLIGRPGRQTKLQLLEEASRQLQESEAIGTSLADRLGQIKTKLTPS